MSEQLRLEQAIASAEKSAPDVASHLRRDLAAVRLWKMLASPLHDWDDYQGDEPETLEEYNHARLLVNTVLDALGGPVRHLHETTHGSLDPNWEQLGAGGGTYLSQVGTAIVDGGTVGVEVDVRVGENEVNYATRIQTPEGDGGYVILAGRVDGLGRCIVVAFDHEEIYEPGRVVYNGRTFKQVGSEPGGTKE